MTTRVRAEALVRAGGAAARPRRHARATRGSRARGRAGRAAPLSPSLERRVPRHVRARAPVENS